MTVRATVTVSGANVPAAVEYEVSGMHDGTLGNGSKPVEFGKAGNNISFLTLRRKVPCKVAVSVSGKCAVSIDGGKDKTIRSSVSLPTGASRMVLREAVK